MRRFALSALIAAGLTASSPRAETVTYAIAVPPDGAASYELPIRVAHAGRLVVDATWSGGRLLALRLVRGEGTGPVVRRSGPSPQRIDLEVTRGDLAAGALLWSLEIRALAARDRADGSIRVSVPDPPEIVAARARAAAPPPPPPRVPDPWAVAKPAPAEAPERLARLFAGVEDLRRAVYGADPFTVRDACGWQTDLMRWLAARRDGLAAGGAPFSPESLRFVGELARAVRSVEDLRTSANPLIAGPVPKEPLRRRAWLAARRDAVRPIERDLDALSDRSRRGHVPELRGERWLPRLIACLTATERYFEARVRVAPGVAEGAELAEAQWPRILATAPAFDALASWSEDPAAP